MLSLVSQNVSSHDFLQVPRFLSILHHFFCVCAIYVLVANLEQSVCITEISVVVYVKKLLMFVSLLLVQSVVGFYWLCKNL